MPSKRAALARGRIAVPASINVHAYEERRLRDLLAELAPYAAHVRLQQLASDIGEAAEISDLTARRTYLDVLRKRDAANAGEDHG
jgi:hypothetical protein